MPIIHLETLIRAPVELCFDLARSVDVHMASTKPSRARAVAGVTSGMMKLGDTVTWEAVHFGVRQRLTSKITVYERPRVFTDEMQRGAFKKWHHTHLFEARGAATLMVDHVRYMSPLGILGRIADQLFLEDYMIRLLAARNKYIKGLAEDQTSGETRARASAPRPTSGLAGEMEQ